MSLEYKELTLELSLRFDESEEKLNLTSEITDPFKVLPSLSDEYSFCEQPSFKIVEDEAGTVPDSSSFLATALEVDLYSLNLITVEVTESTEVSFYVQAANLYEEVSRVKINLDISYVLS
mmetsp:Transcript_9217/g.13982  ORF Transcript_9217/g.13982 Transcript_9217/m.13982 type:complete len:120 (-) Transcript_9217:940-1299(-)